MDRHDTHLLSEESEIKEKEEDDHQFNFNDSIYLSYDSEDKLVSKESVNNSPLHLNYIEQNNIENNDNNDNNNININNNFSNVSIISSKEIGDIFCGNENIKKNNKKRKKPKKNRYFIKLRKIKLNNDDNEIVENCLTYVPTLKNEIIDKNINKLIDKNRRCVSLNNKNKKNKNRNKLKNHRKMNSLNEKEFLYFFYNDDNKGNENLRNMLNIINKQKTHLLKVTNNFFSIKNKEKIGTKEKNKFPLLNPKNKSNKDKDKDNKTKANSREGDKNNKLKNNNKDNSIYRKINNVNSNKNKPKLILSKSNKSNNNNNNINNKKFLVNTNYSNKNTSKSKIRKSSNQSTSLIFTKNNEKVEMPYNKFCGKKNQRVKSTEFINEKKPNGKWQNIHEYKDETFLNVYKKNKKENRIHTKKLFCSKNGIINCFSRHFGNNKNCPVCQANKQKHDESIREKGICPMIPNIGDDDSQSRLQNRRVYSALSRILSKMNRNHNEFDFLYNNLHGAKTKNRIRSKINGFNYGNKMFKNFFNEPYNKINLKRSGSAMVRKLKIDRNLSKENNSSIRNKENIYKNQSIKN